MFFELPPLDGDENWGEDALQSLVDQFRDLLERAKESSEAELASLMCMATRELAFHAYRIYLLRPRSAVLESAIDALKDAIPVFDKLIEESVENKDFIQQHKSMAVHSIDSAQRAIWFHDDSDARYVFISYVSENRPIALRLRDALVQAGIRVWIDVKALKPGVRWKDAIRDGIKEGHFFLPIFSRELSERDESYMYEELSQAIERLRRFPAQRRWFLPVRIDDSPIPNLPVSPTLRLEDFQCADLGEDWDAGVSSVIEVIRAFR